MPSVAQVLYFDAPGKVSVRQEALDTPAPHQVQVATDVSAISPGTEMLFYRGQVPAHMATDASIQDLAGRVAYPLRYGYSCVGRVTHVGSECDPQWLGQRVFAFKPHASHFNSSPQELLPIPDDVEAEAAALFPNMETAISLVHDCNPRVGERILVYGQGIVGLLTTWLLARHPLEALWVVDPLAFRRAAGMALGAHFAHDPARESRNLQEMNPDAILELTGNPQALENAITVAGFHARIIVGSWYGDKPVSLPLGHDFHRNRVTIYSSQVSTLPAQLTARWDKARRYAGAWKLLAQLPHQQLITHHIPLADAASAYQQVDQSPAGTLQVLFTHGS